MTGKRPRPYRQPLGSWHCAAKALAISTVAKAYWSRHAAHVPPRTGERASGDLEARIAAVLTELRAGTHHSLKLLTPECRVSASSQACTCTKVCVRCACAECLASPSKGLFSKKKMNLVYHHGRFEITGPQSAVPCAAGNACRACNDTRARRKISSGQHANGSKGVFSVKLGAGVQALPSHDMYARDAAAATAVAALRTGGIPRTSHPSDAASLSRAFWLQQRMARAQQHNVQSMQWPQLPTPSGAMLGLQTAQSAPFDPTRLGSLYGGPAMPSSMSAPAWQPPSPRASTLVPLAAARVIAASAAAPVAAEVVSAAPPFDYASGAKGAEDASALLAIGAAASAVPSAHSVAPAVDTAAAASMNTDGGARAVVAPVSAPVSAPIAASVLISAPMPGAPMPAPIANVIAPASRDFRRMPQPSTAPSSSSSSNAGLGNPYVEASFWVSLTRMQQATQQLRYAGSPDNLIQAIEDGISTMRGLLMTHRSSAAMQQHHAAATYRGATVGNPYDHPPRV